MNIMGTSIKPDNRPLYDRAVEALNRYIEKGGFKPGDRLPSESVLARQLGISRPTLREALGAMESHGLIARRHGVGVFVTAPMRGAMHGGLEKLESLYSLAIKAAINAKRIGWEIDLVPANQEAARCLEIAPGAPLVRAQATIAEHSIDDMSGSESYHYFAYLDSYVKTEYADIEELRAFNAGSMLDFLLQKKQARLSYTNTRLYSVAADTPAAERLHVTKDYPLLLLVEIFFSEDGAPIVWTRNYFVTEKVNFQIIRRIVNYA